MSEVKWTAARRRGLEAFRATGRAYESSRTLPGGSLLGSHLDGLVYWQTRRWLDRNGYITTTAGPHPPAGCRRCRGQSFYKLTNKGRAELGLPLEES
jgi:hypothetical protein